MTTPTSHARTRPGWMLDETATAGRENLDAGHVRRYDGKEDADAAGEVERLLRWGLEPDSVLVDVGAGTGQLVLAAAPHCSRVVAVDVSPFMADLLAEKVAASGARNIPNSAGVIIDAVRAAKIAADRGIGGPVTSASAYFMKSPPEQMADDVARERLEQFIRGEVER